METVERVVEYLDKVHSYNLATVENGKPHVRVFGTALLYDGKLYIQSGKKKAIYKEILENPYAELCAWQGPEWMRVSGELVVDEDRDVKVAMLEKMPNLKAMYDPDDGNMLMMYFKNGMVTFNSFTTPTETLYF